jgi:hypothetical protein
MFGNFFDDVKWYEWIVLIPLILLSELIKMIPMRRRK